MLSTVWGAAGLTPKGASGKHTGEQGEHADSGDRHGAASDSTVEEGDDTMDEIVTSLNQTTTNRMIYMQPFKIQDGESVTRVMLIQLGQLLQGEGEPRGGLLGVQCEVVLLTRR